MPVEVCYGDTDWVEAANNAIKDRKIIEEIPGVKFEVLQYAGHQLIFENPKGVAAFIIGNRYNVQEKMKMMPMK